MKLFGDTSKISVIKNPFDKKCIKRISITMYKNIFTEVFEFEARIEFKNEKTSGTHTIDKCKDLADAFIKAQKFVESL